MKNTLKRQGCSDLHGGKPPVVPGSWHCCTCNLGGCWPSRNTCFRCLAPRGSSAPLPKPRHQRETQALGRAPQRSPAVEPTQRRASTSGPGVAAPRVVPPRVPAGNGNVDAQAVLKTLRGLGLSEDLLVQVAKSLQPPATKKGFLAGKADGSFEGATAQPSWPE